VFSLDYYADPLGVEVLLQMVGNLLGEAFLDLQSGCEHLYDPRQLGKPDDPVTGQVAHVRHPFERQ
jgi:hypothetical protein